MATAETSATPEHIGFVTSVVLTRQAGSGRLNETDFGVLNIQNVVRLWPRAASEDDARALAIEDARKQFPGHGIHTVIITAIVARLVSG